jgi:CheY-like chemotaxis protein
MERDDKRRHARAAIWGVARLTGPACAYPEILAVRDLSPGGLGLTGGHPLAIGAGVDLDVRLFGQALTLSGQVAWSARGPAGPTMGIKLGESAALVDALGELEERLAMRSRRGRALLIESNPARAALLGEYLWSHGYEVEECATPLSAIGRLARGDIDMVAIGPHLSTCSGGEFAAFVAESFPRVHRLVVAHTAEGTGPLTVAAAFESERAVTASHAIVCSDDEPRPRR